MDNQKNLAEELLKADGIDPAHITEAERAVFRDMLAIEKKRISRLSWKLAGTMWIHIFLTIYMPLGFLIGILRSGLKAPLEELVEVQTKPKQSKPENRPEKWSIIMKSKITKFAAAVIIIAAVTVIYQITGSIDGASITFAQVLDKIQKCNYTFDATIEPMTQSSNQEFDPIRAKVIVVQPHKLRLNWSTRSDGDVSVTLDYNTKQYLQLLHKNKTGTIKDYNTNTKDDLSYVFSRPIEKLWDLKNGSEEILGEKELFGRTATGFKVFQEGNEFTIWADSESGLPLYVEALSEVNNFSIATKWSMENFDYEIEPDKELFSLDGPPEYTIVDQAGNVVREGCMPHDDEPTNEMEMIAEYESDFLIKPLEGVGGIKFGMTREMIIEILGEPDQSIGQNCLDYTSTIGLSFLVSNKKGLMVIDCWSQREKSEEGILGGKDFAGKTAKGIGIGSPKDKIISLYGKPNREYLQEHPDIFGLSYSQLDTIFSLKKNKVIHISMQAPK